VSDYVNAYEILSQVRLGLNEHSTAYVQGTDASGKYANSELMRHGNNAQYFLWNILFTQFPEYFLKSAAITFTASVASLPSDCFRLRSVLDSADHDIFPIGLAKRHWDGIGSAHEYYRYGNNLKIDQDGITDTGTIWYYSRCRELDTGAASATNTLALTAKALADYYNGMKIENITDSTNDTITDYTAARVITSTGGITSGDYYGLVSDLPEGFHPLIASRAIITMKMSPRVPIALTQLDKNTFGEELAAAMQAFAGTMGGDVDMDAMFNDFQ
jgi:hypothetical protein